MSFILSGLGVAGIVYIVYKFAHTGSIPAMFRDPFLKPSDFVVDPVLGEAPDSHYPRPQVYQSPAYVPHTATDVTAPSVHTKYD